PAFGYVLEGEYEWAIDDNKPKIFKAGDTFYEPTGCLHGIGRNPSKKNKARFIAIVLHPEDAKDVVIPEKKKKRGKDDHRPGDPAGTTFKETRHEDRSDRRQRAHRQETDPPAPRGRVRRRVCFALFGRQHPHGRGAGRSARRR